MPELPEVETVKSGIAPHVLNQTIQDVVVLDQKLRFPVPDDIKEQLSTQKILQVYRRAKYLVVRLENTDLIIHLGMSGALHIINDKSTVFHQHDRVVFRFQFFDLRYRDPRKFGMILLTKQAQEHHLLQHLGPEPLSEEFTTEHLMASLKAKKQSIKQSIMDNHIVVGVGNIYASESLFHAGIRPDTHSNMLTHKQIDRLVGCIQTTLQKAIAQGGTTLKDFADANGKPGYFKQSLFVYGRHDQPCLVCSTHIAKIKQRGRSSVYCPNCKA